MDIHVDLDGSSVKSDKEMDGCDVQLWEKADTHGKFCQKKFFC